MSAPAPADLAVSVVICAYNAELRLREVLDALRCQIVPPGIGWEIIVVDNNSRDRTAAVAREIAPTLPVPVRVVSEPQQGLIHARRRGWLEARGAIVSYLDDDNVVSPAWIAAVAEFFATHPRAGLVGPRIHPLLDAAPPAHFEYVKAALAIRDRGDVALDTTSSVDGHPPGAGMSSPRAVLEPILAPGRFEVLGRTGEELSSGEDSMIALAIRDAGLEWWYAPSMVLGHRIPPSRLEVPYLVRLYRGLGRSSAHTAAAARRRPLTSREHAGYVWRCGIRFAAYILLSRVSPRRPYRVYTRALASMFLAAAQVHLRAMVQAWSSARTSEPERRGAELGR